MGQKAISEETRWAIVAYKKQKLSNRAIAGLCKVTPFCVATTIKNYENTGHIREKPRSGRPRISNSKEDNTLLKIARQNPRSSLRDLKPNWIIRPTGKEKTASKATISRRLLEFGLESRQAICKPMLSAADRKKRFKWCDERKTYTDWSRVIFSDESNFQIVNRKTKPYVRRFRNEKFSSSFIQKTVQAGGGSIGVWGCVAGSGIGECKLYSGRMNSVFYLEVLEKTLLPSSTKLIPRGKPWEFVQDGAPCHTAHVIRDWFATKNVKKVEWPPRSPDLNPIEHIWSQIDKKLTNHQITSLVQLEELIGRYWRATSKSYCINLSESMARRVKLCMKAKGGYFKY